MIKLDPGKKFFISEDLIGYTDKLVNEGTFRRRVDLLLVGFAYAVNSQLAPIKDYKRHELIYVNNLKDILLPIEATANWYARNLGYPLEDDSDLLEFICSVGIAGTRELQDRWRERRKSQIQWDILCQLGIER